MARCRGMQLPLEVVSPLGEQGRVPFGRLKMLGGLLSLFLEGLHGVRGRDSNFCPHRVFFVAVGRITSSGRFCGRDFFVFSCVRNCWWTGENDFSPSLPLLVCCSADGRCCRTGTGTSVRAGQGWRRRGCTRRRASMTSSTSRRYVCDDCCITFGTTTARFDLFPEHPTRRALTPYISFPPFFLVSNCGNER